MRFASYNLFEGAQDTYPQLKEFVQAEDIDVLCLQEANGWKNGRHSRLKDFAATTGLHNYVYGNSNTKYKLATFSRQPFISSQVYIHNFWHSAIHVTVADDDDVVDVWNIHFDPKNEKRRLEEARQLGSLIDRKLPVLVTGDFNSLSRHDIYPDTLAPELAAQGITKFGEDKLLFKVTTYLESLGLVDVAAQCNQLENTVPTPANKDKYHASQLRLDYMFASNSLAKRVHNIEVPKNPLTDVISDHYPVILTLK